MRTLIATVGAIAAFGAASICSSSAAPVSGFEIFYDAVVVACSPPVGTPAACEAAINSYSSALVAGGVDPALALQSFIELRAEVAAAGGDAEIDGLFEQLLPASGSVGQAVSPV